MAAWGVRVYGGKMQEVIKGMDQLKFTYHPSRKQKIQFLYHKSSRNIRIFIAACQRKTGQTNKFIY